MDTFRARHTQEWWGERNLVLHWPWRGLGGIGRLGRGAGSRSQGSMTSSSAVAPYTVCMTTALLFLLFTLRGALAKRPRFLINTAACRKGESSYKGERVQRMLDASPTGFQWEASTSLSPPLFQHPLPGTQAPKPQSCSGTKIPKIQSPTFLSLDSSCL